MSRSGTGDRWVREAVLAAHLPGHTHAGPLAPCLSEPDSSPEGRETQLPCGVPLAAA